MDNYFHVCPPMMEDQGRQLASFKSATRQNEYIKYINDIWRDDQYRYFLQSHGKEMMDREFNWHKKHDSCWVNACVHKYPTRQSPNDFVKERLAYDSIYDMRIHKEFAPLRKCYRKKYEDYRLNPN